MDADGSNPINLTNNRASDRFPEWSPDGRFIAFTTDRDGDREIYVMNADGSNPINLTNNPEDDIHPAWSPDGYFIAFSSTRNGIAEIFTLDLETGELFRLSNHPGRDAELRLVARWQQNRLPFQPRRQL
uniref:TolB family protein n=1 Tax=Desertifilum tharense IPPAS B-1220 TaxID=1781255 RepID=A0ACD5GRJ2_9CYAN